MIFIIEKSLDPSIVLSSEKHIYVYVRCASRVYISA